MNFPCQTATKPSVCSKWLIGYISWWVNEMKSASIWYGFFANLHQYALMIVFFIIYYRPMCRRFFSETAIQSWSKYVEPYLHRTCFFLFFISLSPFQCLQYQLKWNLLSFTSKSHADRSAWFYYHPKCILPFSRLHQSRTIDFVVVCNHLRPLFIAVVSEDIRSNDLLDREEKRNEIIRHLEAWWQVKPAFWHTYGIYKQKEFPRLIDFKSRN